MDVGACPDSGNGAENTRKSLGGLTIGSGFSGMLNHLTFGLLGSKQQ